MIFSAANRRACWAALLVLLGASTAVVATESQNVLQPNPPATAHSHVLEDLHDALSVMQDHYFSLWLGQWTTAIDWTAAVTSTHLAATLLSLSHSISYTLPSGFSKTQKLPVEAQMVESEINKYFGHVIAYYFGQDAFSLRMQAYDDMLWVVLGWLDTIRLIKEHSASHYTVPSSHKDKREGAYWHATQFIPAFAHRARVFYDLAETGWDSRLCGGGMTWNPHLLPYKNAITNQLFISASVGMYLHFPGDENCSPFVGAAREHPDWARWYETEHGAKLACDEADEQEPEYDGKYLANAVKAYDWLANSGMRNAQGLYTDGFHIRGYAQNHSLTHCDERNDMLYTYNQGVVLSGLRGLWEATGNATYLSDGHELVGKVVRATGWDISVLTDEGTPHQRLGWNGILTEHCDPGGACNQDGQAFKGIFFHHFTTFCTPLPTAPAKRGKTHHASAELYAKHQRSCAQYTPWAVHNAQAALRTRDAQGRFGMWWTTPSTHSTSSPSSLIEINTLDYRNNPSLLASSNFSAGGPNATPESLQPRKQERLDGDPNERGRGRTVETQGGGLAVVRAMWEFLRGSGGYGDDVVGAEL